MTRQQEIDNVLEQFMDNKPYEYTSGFEAGARWADKHPLPLSEEAVKEIVIEHEAWAYEQWHCDVNEKCSFYEWYLEHRKTNK